MARVTCHLRHWRIPYLRRSSIIMRRRPATGRYLSALSGRCLANRNASLPAKPNVATRCWAVITLSRSRRVEVFGNTPARKQLVITSLLTVAVYRNCGSGAGLNVTNGTGFKIGWYLLLKANGRASPP
jgi:hypothetical protein